jgi:hypothetical protein
MRLSEFNISETVDRTIAEHIKKGVPFTECMFRPGSEAFTMFYRAVREMRESIDMDWFDREMLDTDIGECIEIDGEIVPLDVPMEDLTEDKKTWFKDGVEMCSKDCCGKPVTECGCGPDCKHCDCYKINEELDKINFSNMAKIQNASTIGELVIALKPYESEMINDIYDFAIDKGLGEVQQRKAYHGIHRFMRDGENMDDPISIKSIKRIPNIGNAIAPIIADYLDTEFALNLQGISEAEYQGRKVKLNSPKRGGSKKYYVYTKNKKGNVIKVSWGDTTGLKTKANNPGAVKSFVARHDCKNKKDKTKAGYWACRTPRYKSLGVKGGQWW